MDTKPIETRYQGCRFRSRLEARWAVFFDTLAEPWEYERQGYALPSGPYLPDFWLPRQKAWVEVKGQEPTSEELQKCGELRDATGNAVILLSGPPGDQIGFLFCWEIGPAGGREANDNSAYFGASHGGRLFVYTGYEQGMAYFVDSAFRGPVPTVIILQTSPAGVEILYDIEDGYEKYIGPALAAAKSARFEFGESGPG